MSTEPPVPRRGTDRLAARMAGTAQLAGVIVHGILLTEIIISATVLGVEKVINGDAIVGLLGAVAATTAGTTAYRAGVRHSDVNNRADPPGD